jgi:hypothetical protein
VAGWWSDREGRAAFRVQQARGSGPCSILLLTFMLEVKCLSIMVPGGSIMVPGVNVGVFVSQEQLAQHQNLVGSSKLCIS